MLAITFNWSLAVARALRPSRWPASSARSAPSPIVYALARARHRGFSTNVLLLAGVTMNAFFSALILFVQYFANFADTYRTLRWLMGDLDVSSYAADPGRAAARRWSRSRCSRGWRARSTSCPWAPTAPKRAASTSPAAQRVAFFSASLATGAAVSLGGPIGFVGIIVPHLVRLLVGSDHRLVLPASALFGAAFLVGCDVLARTIMAPVELPVGIDHRAHRRPVLPVAAGRER